jgi:hypothetical protein
MSKMVRLNCHWQNAKGTVQCAPGNVVGLKDKDADALIAAGKAEQVPDGTRSLRYAADAPVQIACFAPDSDIQEKGGKAIAAPPEQITISTPPDKGSK